MIDEKLVIRDEKCRIGADAACSGMVQQWVQSKVKNSKLYAVFWHCHVNVNGFEFLADRSHASLLSFR